MAKGGFRGMPGGMNQAAMMKQAQKMQQEMLRMQEEMENKTYSATSGGGMVTAEVFDRNINHVPSPTVPPVPSIPPGYTAGSGPAAGHLG